MAKYPKDWSGKLAKAISLLETKARDYQVLGQYVGSQFASDAERMREAAEELRDILHGLPQPKR